MSHLFDPVTYRSLTIRNRIFVSPMCQYSSIDGMPSDWHLVHLGSRAVGGAGLIIAEATAVTPQGRISPGDTGIWSDAHVQAFQPITKFISQQGATPAIQLAHAGRKASTATPWEGGEIIDANHGGWQPLAPSPLAFTTGHPIPHELTQEEIRSVIEAFKQATRRSLEAGFQVIELHAAHGYLLHQFLSPLSNQRTDDYGGTLENRMRLTLNVTAAIRAIWPEKYPIFVRISATDWKEGGWDIEQSIILCRRLKELGVDLVDCSTGGLIPDAKIPVGPGFQVQFAERIRREVGIATGAVGLINQPEQAEEIITSGKADAVLLARAFLNDPYWPLHAAKTLDVEIEWPKQYARGKKK